MHKIESDCEICNKHIVTRDLRGQKYCSRECYFKAKSISQKGKLTPMDKFWLGKKRDAETCKKISENRKGIKHTEEAKKRIAIGLINRPVSKETRQKLSVSCGGNKNHFWKGGITPINRRLRETGKYKEWRKKVYERDNFTCQECNHKGGRLNADHIKPFSLYPELRFDVNNGRTLCEDCHRQTDTFGRRANGW